MPYWKIFTHDLRSPIQGSDIWWDGTTPYELPAVVLDTSEVECGAGWHFVDNLAAGLQMIGLWPTGRPSRAFLVEPSSLTVCRNKKYRSSQLHIVREATDDEIAAAIIQLSVGFGEHADVMVREQLAWRTALARPMRQPEKVRAGLHETLTRRGLSWTLQEFPFVCGIRSPWTRQSLWDAEETWWDGQPNVWSIGDVNKKSLALFLARQRWDAVSLLAGSENGIAHASLALCCYFTGLLGWHRFEPNYHTHGIRAAYYAGLELASPCAKDKLGWMMADTSALT